MNGILTHTNLSFVSSTTASSAAEEGIGSLTGNVAYAFGEATLRGAENLVIRRKLRITKSLFPHENGTVNKDVDAVYNDILEFSRYGSLLMYFDIVLNIIQARALSNIYEKASIVDSSGSNRHQTNTTINQAFNAMACR